MMWFGVGWGENNNSVSFREALINKDTKAK